MFEDYCLTCCKEVVDGRTYCNDVCRNGDLTSPSLSESSSAFSSPYLHHAHGGDVPPLVLAHDRYSASSSSASSTTWSMTDDESDPEPHVRHGLSYTRRPSGTNNGRAVLHSRTDSGSMLLLPQSAPDDISTFDQRYHGRDDLDSDFEGVDRHASEDPSRPHAAPATITGNKPLRKKANRASLPAYFSMLQINTASSSSAQTQTQRRTSPTSAVASSATSTLHNHHINNRPSPPTPRLGLMAAAERPHHTPRGRRRQSNDIRPTTKTVSPSPSRSPSPGRRRDSDEKVADWSNGLGGAVPPPRPGSPPEQQPSSQDGTEQHHRVVAQSSSQHLSEAGCRGRLRAEGS
ncbi:hypothetical protein HMN09_00042300 [Mycena chlorophos]|uniref:Uncharacterized protein n=1 Tax=Mycena chlorophos TaxID=658473 RepID=A0A8H6WPS9_MYCCL|nr:hypothetical protein HMN09_00042300 [Mycena chlorophos]